MLTNLTDISNVTDRVLDIYLRTVGGEDGISCEHLTVTERAQIARLMKWESSAYLSQWIADAPADADPANLDSMDYEGAILDQADARDGAYL